MKKTIRIGIAGFGYMGKTHTYAYSTIPFFYKQLPFRTELAGVCSRTISKAEEAKELYGFGFATDDYDELVNRKDIDVINICTPNNLHKEMIIKAIRNGKNIYCDKPLAINFPEAEEIMAAAGVSPGTVFGMTMQNRFFPATMKAKQLMDEGFTGRVLSFRACYLHSSLADPDKKPGWKQDAAISGGGALVDLGSHIFDLIYHLMGEYQEIYAKTDIVHPERTDASGIKVRVTGEDKIICMVRMKNGALGTIEASKVATGVNDEMRFEIHGIKGAMKFNIKDADRLDIYDNTAADGPLGGKKGYSGIDCIQKYPEPGGEFPNPRLSIGWIRSHVACLYNFLDGVYKGKSNRPDMMDGAYIQYVMEKAYESDRLDRWVRLERGYHI